MIASVELWHNPRCTKSRAALGLLEERGLTPRVIRYLDTPPTRARLAEVAALLGGAGALVRRKEALFGELGLEGADDNALLDALAAHPKLIERPVLMTAKGARIGRPTEALEAVL